MIRALLAAALLAGTTLAAAPASADDPRLVERMYDANKVVTVQGKANVQATIRFGEAETIENIAIGDSQKWQVTPNKRGDLLFIKPLADRAATNMTVVTNKHTYLFDLVASPANRNPLYVLSFAYPEEEAEEETQVAEGAPPPPEPNAFEVAAATDPYAVVDPSQLNFAWATKGDSNLLPARIYDDGDATFLSWADGTPTPAILVRDHEGTEGPVNFAVRGNVIVVDGVPREIVLRSGGNVATLTNQGPIRAAAPVPNPQALAQFGPNAEVK